MTQRESAVEHLRNAQQLARNLHDLLTEKDLVMLARDVAAVESRIVRALDEMALGNLGRAAITSEGRQP
jgi:hypothetical protein